MKFPTYEEMVEMAQNVAEKMLDEYEYKGKTLRQWIEIISAFEHGTNLAEVGTDVPDIVRCKDCKHWIPYDWMFSEVWQSKNIADYPEDEIGCDCCDMAMKANDFCSRAERREVTT